MNKPLLIIGIPFVVLSSVILLYLLRPAISPKTIPASLQEEEEQRLLKTPENDQKYIDLANYYKTQERWADSEAMSHKGITVNPANETLYIQLGNLYRHTKRFDEAIAIIQKLLTINPKSDWAYLVLGNTYRDQGNPEKAIEMFEKATTLSPKQYQAYKELGRTYLLTNNVNQAEVMFLKAIAIEPNPQEPDNSYLDLANLYESQGKSGDAQQMRAKAVSLSSPKN